MASPMNTSTSTTPAAAATNGKRVFSQGRRANKKQKSKRERNMKEGSSDDVLLLDIQALVKTRQETQTDTQEDPSSASPPLPEPGSEIDVEVLELSSTGDGLAVHPGSPPTHIYVVPFVAPGDVARVRVFRHVPADNYSVADFLSITTPSPLRDDSRIRCPYFASCSGCQFQMLDYPEQLRHKRRIVEKAFRNFSHLPPEMIPAVGDTIGSPLQYGYRTKLTPHFDGPPGSGGRRANKPRPTFTSVPNIGFNQKGRRLVLDIEDCPIGTDAVRLGMKRERARMQTEFTNYKSGATILLRETTKRYPKDGQADAEPPPTEIPDDAVRVETDHHVDIKTCVTDNKATTSEYIDSYIFTNPAGSFFQNNNSILPPFTDYIRQHILPPSPPSSSRPIKHLIDAYSGSGLFTITLSGLFASSTGIDIAADSIAYARKNAALNRIPESECTFMAADAPQLFRHVTSHPDETVVVIDPPRKGCDASFLRQLLRFGPRRVVYVSCNVHTQARDVGVLVRGEVGRDEAGGEVVEGQGNGAESEKGEAEDAPKKLTRYSIESIRGFDFFPQTGHVEGVAVLSRVDDP
ncbi:hypothetical protein ACRALDRAFT_1067535 [Sodiomyces alcalophilus JCM 7366]|uniref:uncharacterized protein n=1 Tax=Sodiomyces alcalophilus JCM 7366 TaxID=591952 RepID=UPI0039B5FC31